MAKDLNHVPMTLRPAKLSQSADFIRDVLFFYATEVYTNELSGNELVFNLWPGETVHTWFSAFIFNCVVLMKF